MMMMIMESTMVASSMMTASMMMMMTLKHVLHSCLKDDIDDHDHEEDYCNTEIMYNDDDVEW